MQRAILNRTTLVGIEKAGGISQEFLRLAYFALFNDYVSHCIKVLERSRGAASFWYIYKADQGPIDKFLFKSKIDLADFDLVSGKLKQIRDRTHFHIDFESVKDAKAVWQQAGLKGSALSKTVDQLWLVLTDVQQRHSLSETQLPNSYTVESVRDIVRKMKA